MRTWRTCAFCDTGFPMILNSIRPKLQESDRIFEIKLSLFSRMSRCRRLSMVSSPSIQGIKLLLALSVRNDLQERYSPLSDLSLFLLTSSSTRHCKLDRLFKDLRRFAESTMDRTKTGTSDTCRKALSFKSSAIAEPDSCMASWISCFMVFSTGTPVGREFKFWVETLLLRPFMWFEDWLSGRLMVLPRLVLEVVSVVCFKREPPAIWVLPRRRLGLASLGS
mmetsp:Transcript_13246/g.24548  ORF Transcript_13246/g.24548 Transcript_13246/m.24548 type:complete len:222 (-) Transcript_13246:443-1108(-)